MKDEVIVKQISVRPLQVHTYLVACPHTRRAVIIDPAGDEERVLTLIKEEDSKCFSSKCSKSFANDFLRGHHF